ncbi:MAG: glycoside hydrolase family 31 protein [Pseudomonadales bacterium]|nr:glycoside hydrolase family 31 protein [Pseudomonadales bacterium]
MTSKNTEITEAQYAKAFCPNILRSAWVLVKNVIRHPILFFRTFCKHPNLENHFDEYAAKVSFGRTDHPLDALGPMQGVFSALPAMLLRSAECVLDVELVQQQGNRFLFRANGWNIFRLINLDHFYKHVYETESKKPSAVLNLCIEIPREDVCRVRLQKEADFSESPTPMIANDITDKDCKVELTEDACCYRLKTAKLSLHIYKKDFRIELYDNKGKKITSCGGKTDNQFGIAMDSYPLGFVRDRRHRQWYAVNSFDLTHDESIYGLGEHFGPMNKVGESIRLWINEGVGNSTGRVYKTVPFYVSTRGYGVFYNHTHPMTFWVGSKEKSKVQVAVEEQKLDYYLFAGNIREVLYNYTDLTGRSPLPPKFSFGTWISRMSYLSQQQILDVAKTLREKKFPADVIHMDVSWFTEDWKCDWQFDKTRFPDHEAMCRELHQQNFRFSLWQDPYVLKGTAPWEEAQANNFLAKTRVPFAFTGQFEAAPIDFTRPEAAEWYKNRLLRPLLEAGVDVIKTDFGEGIQPSMQFAGGDGHAMHNVYPLLYNKAAYEISREVHGEDNAMVWGRSAYAGSQRYPVQWSGDNATTYGSMQGSLRGGLGYGLSGFTFWSQDTGGFVGVPTDELTIRWTQLSIFQSHLRYHGCYPFREPWQYAEATQNILREYLNLRYQLIPYLYSESIESAACGLPVLRPLVLDYQHDRTVHDLDDQFMSGRSILVAPIMQEMGEMRDVNSRTFYLPEGIWYDFFSKECKAGRQWITQDYPIDKIPIWFKGGSVVPFGPVVQSTSELGDETPLDLVVLLDQHDKAAGQFHLNKNSVFQLTAESRDGQVSVSITKGLPVSEVRVFGPAGEIERENIVLQQG